MKKIAYLGMGIMGSGMALNLIEKGYEVTVWNRTAEKCKPLVEKGAEQADTPAEAVKDADVIMYCLADHNACREVVFGKEGVMNAVKENQTAVNMSTVHPDLNREEMEAYNTRGVEYLDAPVFGSKNEARNAELWVIAGGSRAVFDKMKPVFEAISQSQHYMGETGKGSAMKLTGNMIVSSQIEALGEGLLMGTKAGLDPQDIIDVLDIVDFRSPIFKGMGESVIKRDFSTDFALKWLLKDTNLIAKFAEDLRAPVPAASAVRETVKTAVNQGWGEENASAMIKALELAGRKEITR